MEQLKRRKTGIKSSLTALTRNYEELLETATDVAISAKLKRIVELCDKFKEVQEELGSLYTTTEDYLVHNNEDETYLEEIYYVIAMFESVLEPAKRSQRNPQTKNRGVKLPHLQLPEFKGDPKEWNNFWDMFVSVVHDNEELSQIQKLTYLRG